MRGFLKIAALAALALSAAACASTPPVNLHAAIAGAHGNGARIVTPDKPQSCVPFARERSGIALRGDAYTWWDAARGKYNEGNSPHTGSVMVMSTTRGHLAVVRSVVSSREIRVDHANWMNDGRLYLNTPVIDVSPNNDWSVVQVWNTRDGSMGVRKYQVQGFITPGRLARN